MTNILLISKNPDFAEDLAFQISSFDENMQIFTEAEKSAQIDLILLDEEENAIEHLKEKHQRAPLVFLSDKEFSASSVYKSIKKPFRLEELLNLVSSCVNLIENTEDGYLRFGKYELRPIKKEIICLNNGKKVKLTEKEVAILRYLYNAGNKMVNKNDLLENVWNYSADVSTHTLETHIYRLRQKIEKVDKRSKIIITRDGGYLLKH